ncbi:MAG: putative toxin-antitoxin system toxin component, PIN family [Gemmataceae bacterium]|nr:putative toxin-antitoxin system toxin component, PIN family [Gemmataceae bacterium]MCI0738633.1 putative toxin-antitoxin system toxin component, PIN family [Gemmataceae bacterium]
MLTAILDTNVLIRAALRPGSPSARVVDAYLDGTFRLALSQAVLQELLTVLLLPDIREFHGWSDDKILQFMLNLPAGGVLYPGETRVPADVPRDISDVKFLSLAHEANADYLVTKDGRHLLRLKKYGRTKIVTPTQFLKVLP